jgi:glycosyltransferase involved in cell wall biosynthesis
MRQLVSILIDNYNYAGFLQAAIESALNQTHRPIEIIVVDDGSTDSSREVIEAYKDSVIPIFKENGGQASALNVGVAKSRGTIICLLDSDDEFFPTKVERVVQFFGENDLKSKPALVHHPLQIRDEKSAKLTGELFEGTHASPLNLYDFAKRFHYIGYYASATSGISLSRPLANLLFPLPENRHWASVDDFVVKGASLVGQLYSFNCPLGIYRVHGGNLWFFSRTYLNRSYSRQFHETLDAYLNRKLIENGRSPVMAFFESKSYLAVLLSEKRYIAAIWFVIKAIALRRDLDIYNSLMRKFRRRSGATE